MRPLLIAVMILALGVGGVALGMAQDTTPTVTNELGTPCASPIASPMASPVASPVATALASPVASPSLIVDPGCPTGAATPAGTT